LSNRQTEAERFERLSKSVSDRELAAYYAERAKELRSRPAILASAEKQLAAVKEQADQIQRRATAQANLHRAVKPTDNKMVNQTARAGLLASAEAADNERREHERRAGEAEHTSNLTSDRTIYRHYQDKRREHLALAELARSRADSFRRAAANVGQ
jgi:hypothetical protein